MKDGVFFFQAEDTTATTTPVGWDTFVFRPTYVEVYTLPFTTVFQLPDVCCQGGRLIFFLFIEGTLMVVISGLKRRLRYTKVGFGGGSFLHICLVHQAVLLAVTIQWAGFFSTIAPSFIEGARLVLIQYPFVVARDNTC